MRLRVILVAGLVVSACGSDRPESITTSPPEIPGVTTPATEPPTTTSTTTDAATTTITVAPTTTVDTTPPELMVSVPEPDARVDERHFRFEGVTEPGVSLMAAARYAVVVEPDGTWSTALVLNPGGNVATFTATDGSGNTTELEVPIYYDPPLELRADGLGPATFTDPMDASLQTLTELLGAPSGDRIVTRETLPSEVSDDPMGVFMATAYPAIDYARFATWDSVGLMAMFSDEGTEYGVPGPPNFNGWILHDTGEYGPDLTTGKGIGIGATVAQLETAYGELHEWFEEPDELTGAWHYLIDSGIASARSPGSTLYLYGHYSGDPSSPGTVVIRIQAGFRFDEC